MGIMRKAPLALAVATLVACGGGSKDSSQEPINAKPSFKVIGALTTAEDTPLVGVPLSATDADNDSVAFVISEPPTRGDVVIDKGGKSFTYTPHSDLYGQDTFVIQADDGTDVVSQSILVDVTPVNDRTPKANSIAEEIDVFVTQTVKGVIEAEDADFLNNASGALTFALVDNKKELLFGELSLCEGEQALNTETGKVTCEFTYTIPKDKLAQLPFSNQEDASERHKSISETIKVFVSDGEVGSVSDIVLKLMVSDPLAPMQWHLQNFGQYAGAQKPGVAGHDINVVPVFEQGIFGADVKVAVVDSGLEIAHPDLKENVLPDRSVNFIEGAANPKDPTPTDAGGDHGTSVAGLIASVMNDKGGRGVAPEAKLMGLNWLENQSFEGWKKSHGGAGVTDDARIINQSYGVSFPAPMSFVNDRFLGDDNAFEEAFLQTTTVLNEGKGIAFVKSAGNSYEFTRAHQLVEVGGTAFDFVLSADWWDDKPIEERLVAVPSGLEPSGSSFYNTNISALSAGVPSDMDADGNEITYSPLASYSSVGSNVWVSAPAGEDGRDAPAMITADLTGCNRGYAESTASGFNSGLDDRNTNCDYTSTFNGTSSAAPVASGVLALMFSANPELSWRDARDILAKTSVKIDEDFKPIVVNNGEADYVAEPGWVTNAAGYAFHNWYGFGRVNAAEAVSLAQSDDYKPLPMLHDTGFIAPSGFESQAIPEKITGLVDSVKVIDDLTIEGVQVKVSIQHTRDTDIALELISPAGTSSTVLTPRNMMVMDQSDAGVEVDGVELAAADYNDAVFLTNAFYGESSKGEWRLKVIDTNSGDFKFYGFVLGSGAVEVITPNNAELGTLLDWSLRIYGH